jgi:hypothetical protein
MDLYRIIRELAQERDRIQRIIDSLEEMKPGGKVSVRQEGAARRRGRKSMDPAARRQVSERMRLYWAQRKEERAAATSKNREATE